ncbi:MFS transporter [Pseudomonas graminis]
MKVTSRFLMLFLLFTGYVLVYIDKTVIGFALLPIRDEFHLTPQQVGYISGIFFLSYSLCQFPAGWLNDRLGYRRVLILSLSIVALCALLFGWLGASLSLLMLFRFMAGIGHSGYPSASAKAVSSNFVVHQHTFAQSVLLSTAGLAMAVGPLLAVWALHRTGWHHAFLILGGLIVVAAVSMALLLPAAVATPDDTPRIARASLWQSMRQPLFWQLFMANFLINIPLYSLLSWLPSFLAQRDHLDLAAIGGIMSISGIGCWLSSLASGWFVGRYMAGREPRVICVATLVAAVAMMAVYVWGSTMATTWMLLVTNIAMICAFVTCFTLPMKRFPHEMIGSIIGLLNAGGVLGGFVGPIAMGYLLAAGGGSYLTSFLFLMLSTVLAGLVLQPNLQDQCCQSIQE